MPNLSYKNCQTIYLKEPIPIAYIQSACIHKIILGKMSVYSVVQAEIITGNYLVMFLDYKTDSPVKSCFKSAILQSYGIEFFLKQNIEFSQFNSR